MNIEQLDNIHFSDYFHTFSSIGFTIITYSFLTSIYQNRKDMDTNLNKAQNNMSIYIYSCPEQQRAGSCWCSGSIWGLVTDD